MAGWPLETKPKANNLLMHTSKEVENGFLFVIKMQTIMI